VVKADAYGLGVARVAPALAAAGCTTFVVALPDEALSLRRLLPKAEILALCGLLPGAEAEFEAHGVVPVLNSLGDIGRWRAYAGVTGRRQPAWVHLDTGMNRLGLGGDEARLLAAEPERLAGLDVRGWMSHLVCAELRHHPLSSAQLGRFQQALARLPRSRRSLANSAAIFRNRAFHFDLVRPGAALYGINPTPEAANPMAPVVSVQARILQVRSVDAGMSVGYGATHVLERRSRIATIAVGYADGCPRFRAGSGTASVHIGGQPAPMVGRVSMDLITVDVTGLPEAAAHPGGWAEIVGRQRGVDDLAVDAGTIGYEILTGLSRRHHRVWLAPDADGPPGGPGC
jgi:alanine racemase